YLFAGGYPVRNVYRTDSCSPRYACCQRICANPYATSESFIGSQKHRSRAVVRNSESHAEGSFRALSKLRRNDFGARANVSNTMKPQAFVPQIISSTRENSPWSIRQHGSVLFADVSGFTPMSEALA